MKYTDEQKRMFYTSGYFNRWKLNFQEIALIIENETIHTESPVMKESICENEDLVLGGCIASSFSFEVSEIIQYDLTGIEFTALLETVSEDGEESLITPMGRYRVDSAETLDDKDYKQVTAYDALYDASDDVSEWYQSFFAEDQQHTVKETRVSLLEHFGIPMEEQTLINDDILLSKTIDPNGSLTGITVLRALCELNGGFGRMNRQGCFEVIQLHGLGVFPEDQMGEEKNIYPEDDPEEEVLYPEDSFEYLGISDYENDYPEWRNITAEDYMTLPIGCLNIRDTEDGLGITVGDDLSNPYVITGNFFLYGKSSEELSEIGGNILSKIKGITYRPNTTELNGLPYIETGDVYAMMRKSEPVESYVLSRTLKGIDALIDTYEAKGNEMRANEVSANEEIMQIKGKTFSLKKDIDGVSAELTNFETETTTKFELTDGKIETEITDRKKRDNELSTKIEQTAEKITLEASKTYETKTDAGKTKNQLTGRIDVMAGQVVLKADANGNIVLVELTADPKEGTAFKVEADNISLTAQEAINFLAGGTLNLTGQKIKIESDNFSVDEKGKATVNSIDILGGSINIGDKFIVDENGICSELEGDFTIQAKNLNLTADEAIELISGGTINLSSDDINIESTNFSLDTDGHVTARGINIEGGSINISTAADGDTVIYLRNANFKNAYDGPVRFLMSNGNFPYASPGDGVYLGDMGYDFANKKAYICAQRPGRLAWVETSIKEEDIPPSSVYLARFYGSGAPIETPLEMGARAQENYVDLETAELYYANRTDSPNNGDMVWTFTGATIPKENFSWKEIEINTENAITIRNEWWEKFGSSYYRMLNEMNIGGEKIYLHKTGYKIIDNFLKEYDESAEMILDIERDSSGNFYPVIAFNVPIKAPNIS